MSPKKTTKSSRRCDPAETGRPAAPGSKVRRSRTTFWRAVVLVGVHVLFGLHMWHLYATGESVSPIEPSESMQLADRAIVNAGLIFFGVTILATVIFGRFFCGWACHLLALQDLSLALLKKVGIKPNPLRSRALMVVPALAAIYMFVWPWVYRLWIGAGVEVHAVELTTSDFWETFPHPAVAIATFVVCGFAIVYFLGSKGFCTYACPYGALFALADKASPGKIRVDDSCDQCGHCTIACTSNVAVAQEVRDWGIVKDTGCMKCMDCVSVCPKGALSFGFGTPTLGTRPRAEPRPAKPKQTLGEELLLLPLFAAGFFAVRGVWVMDEQKMPFLFSLGIAGILCAVYLPLVRLLTRPQVKLQQLTFKHGGKLTRAGKVLVALSIPLTLLWLHTALVRYREFRAEQLMGELEPATHAWFDPLRTASAAGFEDRVRRLQAHSRWLRDWAFVEGVPNARRLIWTNVWLGNLDAARTLAREARSKGHADTNQVVLMGDMALAQGDARGAADLYRTVLDFRPDHAEVTAKLVPLLIDLRLLDEALAELERALQHHPDEVLLLLQHASVSMVLGKLDTVEATLRHAVAVAPERPEPRAMLAQFLAQLGRGDEIGPPTDLPLDDQRR